METAQIRSSSRNGEFQSQERFKVRADFICCKIHDQFLMEIKAIEPSSDVEPGKLEWPRPYK
jgi:hypothetical protein